MLKFSSMNLQRRLLALIRKADSDFNLINENDKILIGISGGKDSVLLAYLLKLYQKFGLKKFTIQPCFLDLGFEKNEDFDKLVNFFKSNDMDLIVENETDVYKILSMHKKEDGLLPCSICSRMKKAGINAVANRLGFNKVSFAHHNDDAIETLFMNMTYGGKVNTFEPKMHLEKSNITFIRPLIYVREHDIKLAVKNFNLPVLKSKCPNDKFTKREVFKNFLNEYYQQFPEAYLNFSSMLSNSDSFKLFFENLGYSDCKNLFIKKVRTFKDMNENIFIRKEVFIKEQHIDPIIELDDNKVDAVYFNLYYKNTLIGCIRYIQVDENTYKIGRLAILKKYRNKGYATFLMKYLMFYLTNRVCPIKLICCSQIDAVKFYEKLGFKKVNNKVKMIASIKHFEMEILLDKVINIKSL